MLFVFIIVTINTVQYGGLVLWGSNFCGFLSMVIYEALYSYMMYKV